jgi:hypothetical protein
VALSQDARRNPNPAIERMKFIVDFIKIILGVIYCGTTVYVPS